MAAKRIPDQATRSARPTKRAAAPGSRSLAYYCAANTGGIMEYAVCQAAALAEAGLDVQFLCRPDFHVQRLSRVTTRPELGAELTLRSASRMGRWVARLRDARRGAEAWARVLGEAPGRRGLDACYHEYFAPLWVRPLCRLAATGTVIGTVAHDPVRDFVVGPRWWHERSVAAGYSFVRDVFVHDNTPVDTGRPTPHIRRHIIPMGPPALPSAKRSRAEMRTELGLAPGEVLFISFGHLRDNKNLDLFLRAMAQLPGQVKLLVAGNENAQSQKPAAYYQELAQNLGVGPRCRWMIRYVTNEEAADLFVASDFCLVTYDRTFRSASGALNAARRYRRPGIASDGGGPLTKLVARYQLGRCIEPDSLPELVEGVRQLLAAPPTPDWEALEREHSWQRNAELVTTALFAEPRSELSGASR